MIKERKVKRNDDMLVEEIWKRRQKKKHSYFKKSQIANYKLKRETKIIPKIIKGRNDLKKQKRLKIGEKKIIKKTPFNRRMPAIF